MSDQRTQALIDRLINYSDDGKVDITHLPPTEEGFTRAEVRFVMVGRKMLCLVVHGYLADFDYED